jgi:hypothetical protein
MATSLKGRRPELIPPKHVFIDSGPDYWKNYRTYSEYNYLRPGPVSWIRRTHFRKALALTRDFPQTCEVIDFGCADGFFIPTLAKRFKRVVGIDNDENAIRISEILKREMGIENADLLCNRNMSIHEIKSRLGGQFDVVFLLETLEHIGDEGRLYEAQRDFLMELSELSTNIVISVPKMVGIPFVVQRAGLWLFRMNRERISFRAILRVGILRDNSELEKQWKHGHLGFDYRELEKRVKEGFRIARRKWGFFQNVYLLQKENEVV